MVGSWSARQYTAFEDERTRPVRDLVAGIDRTTARFVVDLGCGPGNSTEVIAARFPDARILGIDSSADMIAAARRRMPMAEFDCRNLIGWRPPGRPDVILANAVLQWVPDHATLLPTLIDCLGDGGALAVQMPDNLQEPAHRLMRAVAQQGPWSAALADAAAARTPLPEADWYFRLLRPQCARVDIWQTTYHHCLFGGAAAVVEWFKGSGLRPFLAPLADDERAEFLRRYTDAIAAAYPTAADGSVLLPFPRLFFVAAR